mmetsp:Transcript_30838/g.89691  ORF Transcript_30838/g.89691 Transcript_30838/m.89691 type:complete len:736 (-) Transcript_30838:100-2307(-)
MSQSEGITDPEAIPALLRFRDHALGCAAIESRFGAVLLAKSQARGFAQGQRQARDLFREVAAWAKAAVPGFADALASTGAAAALAALPILDLVLAQQSDTNAMLTALDTMISAALLKQDRQLLLADAQAAFRRFQYDLAGRSEPQDRWEELRDVLSLLTAAERRIKEGLMGQQRIASERCMQGVYSCWQPSEEEIVERHVAATMFLNWRQIVIFHLLALQLQLDEFPERVNESVLHGYIEAHIRDNHEVGRIYFAARRDLLLPEEGSFGTLDRFTGRRFGRLRHDADGQKLLGATRTIDLTGRLIYDREAGTGGVGNYGYLILMDHIRKDVEALAGVHPLPLQVLSVDSGAEPRSLAPGRVVHAWYGIGKWYPRRDLAEDFARSLLEGKSAESAAAPAHHHYSSDPIDSARLLVALDTAEVRSMRFREQSVVSLHFKFWAEEVERAWYGAGDDWNTETGRDVTDHVRELMHASRSFVVDSGLFSDPLAEATKTLLVEARGLEFVDHTFGPSAPPEMDPNRIVHAWYGCGQHWLVRSPYGRDVTARLIELLKGKRDLDADQFRDPCPGKPKALLVEATEAKLRLREGSWMRHRMRPDSVVRAWYGFESDWVGNAGRDVTGRLVELLQAGRPVSASNSLFGDPALLRLKTLLVEARDVEIRFEEGSEAQLPGLRPEHVARAWYGGGEDWSTKTGWDVTDRVAHLLSLGRPVEVTNDALGDPYPYHEARRWLVKVLRD